MSNSIIIVYGTEWCKDCHRVKEVLRRYGLNYIWIDIDSNPSSESFVINYNHGKRIVPTIIFPDGSVLIEPTNACLTEKLRELNLVAFD